MMMMIQLRVELEGTRLLVLEAADHLDKFGNKKARGILAMAKVNIVISDRKSTKVEVEEAKKKTILVFFQVAAPNMALKVLDTAIQVHGAAGVCSDTVLAHLWATARTLRIADGPDEVHLGTIGKLELQRASKL